MLRAARFLEKSLEAELAAQSATTDHARNHFAELARTWRRMAEDVFQDSLPAQRLAA
jgi:hypothetical protein